MLYIRHLFYLTENVLICCGLTMKYTGWWWNWLLVYTSTLPLFIFNIKLYWYCTRCKVKCQVLWILVMDLLIYNDRSIKYTHSLSVRTQTVRRVIGVSKATKKQSKKNNINRLQSWWWSDIEITSKSVRNKNNVRCSYNNTITKTSWT